MHVMETRPAPCVTAAIAAVKDSVAAEYRALASPLPGSAARSRWQESHGALCIVAHPALIRVSEEAAGRAGEQAERQPLPEVGRQPRRAVGRAEHDEVLR